MAVGGIAVIVISSGLSILKLSVFLLLKAKISDSHSFSYNFLKDPYTSAIGALWSIPDISNKTLYWHIVVGSANVLSIVNP